MGKLKEGDFFQAEVLEVEPELKIEIKDGALKGKYLYFDPIFNPCLEEED